MAGSTILAQFATRQRQREPIATEGLAFILDKSEACRTALSKWVAGFVPDFPTIECAYAEDTSADDDARPDVACYDTDQRLCLLIEGKFWAGLTDNQPSTYLARLEEHRGALVFVVPERRVDSIWAEVRERAHASGGAFGAATGHTPHATTLDDGRAIAVTTWNELLGLLLDAAQRSHEVDVISDLAQLQGFCGAMETEGFVPMMSEELTDLELPRRIVMLAELVKGIIDAAVAQNHGDTKGLRATHGWYSAGSYMRLRRTWGWFGLECSLWARHGSSPLWYVFYESDIGLATRVFDALRGWNRGDVTRVFREPTGETWDAHGK